MIKISPYFDFSTNNGKEKVRFTLQLMENILFYECQCGAGGISSMNAEQKEIPQEIINQMKIHVLLRH
jgi:hypothetical protein